VRLDSEHHFVREGTAVEIRVSDPTFTYELVYALKSASYVATALDGNTVLVRVPDGCSTDKARLHLGFYLANWRARHPGVDAELVAPL
jgi:hypothetical protein